MADKRVRGSLEKRGGYTGSKPGSQMKPPVHRPAAVSGKPSTGQTSPNGQPKR